MTLSVLARDIGRVEKTLEVHLAECAILREQQIAQHLQLQTTVDRIAAAVGADREQRSRQTLVAVAGAARWTLPLLLTVFIWMALRIWPPSPAGPAAPSWGAAVQAPVSTLSDRRTPVR